MKILATEEKTQIKKLEHSAMQLCGFSPLPVLGIGAWRNYSFQIHMPRHLMLKSVGGNDLYS